MAAQKRQQLKGILKSSSSFDKGENDNRKNTKWDEMNIIATYHPPDKDYGHQKIEEPKTPYHHMEEDEQAEDGYRSVGEQSLDADSISAKLAENPCPKVMEVVENEDDEEVEEEAAEENTEHKERRLSFEQKRKLHYNEFQAIKLARQLMDSDTDEESSDKDPTEMDSPPDASGSAQGTQSTNSQ